MMQASARKFLAVKDMANTPLQTIEANVALLARIPGARAYADRIGRALEPLRAWQRILVDESSRLTWTPNDESFDALAVLNKESQQRSRSASLHALDDRHD
jgi:hypothetical protein